MMDARRLPFPLRQPRLGRRTERSGCRHGIRRALLSPVGNWIVADLDQFANVSARQARLGQRDLGVSARTEDPFLSIDPILDTPYGRPRWSNRDVESAAVTNLSRRRCARLRLPDEGSYALVRELVDTSSRRSAAALVSGYPIPIPPIVLDLSGFHKTTTDTIHWLNAAAAPIYWTPLDSLGLL